MTKYQGATQLRELAREGSNLQPSDPKSAVLPIELLATECLEQSSQILTKTQRTAYAEPEH